MKKILVIMMVVMISSMVAIADNWHYSGTYGIENENGIPVAGIAVMTFVDRDTWEKKIIVVSTKISFNPKPLYPINYYIESKCLIPNIKSSVWVFNIRSIFPGDAHTVFVTHPWFLLWKTDGYNVKAIGGHGEID